VVLIPPEELLKNAHVLAILYGTISPVAEDPVDKLPRVIDPVDGAPLIIASTPITRLALGVTESATAPTYDRALASAIPSYSAF